MRLTKNMKVLLMVTVFLVAVAALRVRRWTSQGANTENLQTPKTTVPRTLFGMHIHHLSVPPYTAWPSVSFGTWRLWDARVVWADLEPQKGKWDFGTLDKYVSMAQQHGVQILMPLGAPPAWASARPTEKAYSKPGSAAPPKSMSEWDDYVRTLATRYKGRIRYWELWNEPNLKGFYTGDYKEMVALAKATYTILKQVDATNELVSPSATRRVTGPSWLDSYLKAGGGEYADIIGFHFYVSPEGPEAMVPLIRKVKEVMARDGAGNKPLWCTEVGWYIQDNAGSVKSPSREWPVLSPKQASGYIARAYILSWASGVSRLYWYSWDSGDEGLVGRDGKTLKAPAVAYGQVEKWLVGATMFYCALSSSGIWVCRISRPDKYLAWVVWRPDHKGTFLIPAGWKVKEVQELNGSIYSPPENRTVGIGPSPILLVAPAGM